MALRNKIQYKGIDYVKKIMKLTSVILLSMAAFGQSFKYYSSGATEQLGTLSSPAAGEISVVSAAGAWENVACDTAALTDALKRDTMGLESGVKKGSCCINGHHAACQEIQRQIRERCTVDKQGSCPSAAGTVELFDYTTTWNADTLSLITTQEECLSEADEVEALVQATYDANYVMNTYSSTGEKIRVYDGGTNVARGCSVRIVTHTAGHNYMVWQTGNGQTPQNTFPTAQDEFIPVLLLA